MAKIRSFGASFSFDGTTVNGITDISLPEVSTAEIDITSHDETGGFRKFLGGLKDGGTMTVTGKYDIADSGQDKLRLETDDGTAKACVVTFSDGSTATFNAVLLGYGVTNPLDDAVEFNASLKISGTIVYAAGA